MPFSLVPTLGSFGSGRRLEMLNWQGSMIYWDYLSMLQSRPLSGTNSKYSRNENRRVDPFFVFNWLRWMELLFASHKPLLYNCILGADLVCRYRKQIVGIFKSNVQQSRKGPRMPKARTRGRLLGASYLTVIEIFTGLLWYNAQNGFLPRLGRYLMDRLLLWLLRLLRLGRNGRFIILGTYVKNSK